MSEELVSALSGVLNLLDGYLGSAQWFPFVLLGTGVFFTLYLKFPQLRFFRHAIRIVRGKYDKDGAKGDATHFQALATAISGTVGTGNIGGVGLAIFLGGPAALFWMWMTAFFGMTTKFVEVTLSHKYRMVDEEGHIAGGPMYVMERRLNMKWLAVLFAIATVISSLGSGNLTQSNGIAVAMASTFEIPEWITGAVLAGLLFLVIVGGITRIVKVAEKVVPFMALVYFFGALTVIAVNLPQVGASFLVIFQDAFTGSAAAGGFLGASFAYAFNRGVNRGLFSNEAGQGSAPIAHAAAKADEPVSEGMVSILEPFIDTIIICTLTGLVILSSGVWTEKVKNEFQGFDMRYLEGSYSEERQEDREDLFAYLNCGESRLLAAIKWLKPFAHLDFGESCESSVERFNGKLQVVDGRVVDGGFTLLHNRSIAEDVRYARDDAPYSGIITIVDGKLEESLTVTGKSLVHSVLLTSEAFSRGMLGDYGRYIVSITLILFAFTTAVAWSYYGDRAMTYLFGVSSVLPYRILYVLGFFLAAIADTSLIWLISAVTLALMALPNLLSIILLHREMRDTISDYWEKFDREHPEGY